MFISSAIVVIDAGCAVCCFSKLMFFYLKSFLGGGLSIFDVKLRIYTGCLVTPALQKICAIARMNSISERELSIIGLVARGKGVLSGMVDGIRRRGRPPPEVENYTACPEFAEQRQLATDLSDVVSIETLVVLFQLLWRLLRSIELKALLTIL